MISFRRFFVFFFFLGFWVHAEEKTSQAKLKLSWPDLQSFLGLDNAQMRLSTDEFYSLLQQTGRAPRPRGSGTNGEVVLTRDEFTRLVQSFQTPPPSDSKAFLTKASYRARLDKDSVLVSANLRLTVPQKPNHPLRVDVFPAQGGFEEILLNGRPALSETQQGRLFVTVTEAGFHEIRLAFSVSVPRAEEAQTVQIPIPRTPITDLELEIPTPHLDIALTPSLHRILTPTNGGTRVRALLPPTDTVTAVWNPLAPDEAKGPPQIYATVNHLLSIQEDALRVKSGVSLEILRNTLNEVVLDLPKGFTVLDVTGTDVKDWMEESSAAPTLSILLNSARKGRVDFNVVLERVLTAEKSTTRFTGLTVKNALRQRGFLGVDLTSDAELPDPVFSGLEPKDPFRELPETLVDQSTRLLFGYAYLRPPFSLDLSLARHESLNVVESVIEQATGDTLLRPDGKRVHHVVWTLIPAARQFLRVQLPPKTQLWNAFVNEQPVKPVLGKDGHVMVPLSRSVGGDNTPIPVELVYFEAGQPLGEWGHENIPIPTPDVMVGRLRWTVKTPPGQTYVYLGKEFEKVTVPPYRIFGDASVVAGLTSVGGDGGLDAQESASMQKRNRSERFDAPRARSPLLKEGRGMSVPLKNEGEPLSSMTRGVLPVRVAIPVTSNDSLVFTKTLPETDTTLTLSLWHGPRWIEGMAKVLGVLILLGVFWWKRVWFITTGKKWLENPWAKKVAPIATPLGTFFLGAVLVLVTATTSPFFFFLSLILYTVAVGRWVLSLV